MIWILMLLIGAVVIGLAYLIDSPAEARPVGKGAALRSRGSAAILTHARARAQGMNPEIEHAYARAHARPMGSSASASASAALLSGVKGKCEVGAFCLNDDGYDWTDRTQYEDAFADDGRYRNHDHDAFRSSPDDGDAFPFDDSASLAVGPDYGNDAHAFDHHDSDGRLWINPATGLPMISDGPSGFDVGGNTYGLSNDDHSSRSGIGSHGD